VKVTLLIAKPAARQLKALMSGAVGRKTDAHSISWQMKLRQTGDNEMRAGRTQGNGPSSSISNWRQQQNGKRPTPTSRGFYAHEIDSEGAKNTFSD